MVDTRHPIPKQFDDVYGEIALAVGVDPVAAIPPPPLGKRSAGGQLASTADYQIWRNANLMLNCCPGRAIGRPDLAPAAAVTE
jgi:hypothetical protein